jgi:predicted nuclease with TOPRIM domain
MARGKHSSAALHRRYVAAEQDIRDWKRHSTEQQRQIQRLTAEVNLMPALRHRVETLEMQLELATCAEIADLNRTVAEQREEIRELHASAKRLQEVHDKILEAVARTAPKGEDRLDYLMRLTGEPGVVIDNATPRATGQRIGAEGALAVRKARRGA